MWKVGDIGLNSIRQRIQLNLDDLHLEWDPHHWVIALKGCYHKNNESKPLLSSQKEEVVFSRLNEIIHLIYNRFFSFLFWLNGKPPLLDAIQFFFLNVFLSFCLASTSNKISLIHVLIFYTASRHQPWQTCNYFCNAFMVQQCFPVCSSVDSIIPQFWPILSGSLLMLLPYWVSSVIAKTLVCSVMK